MGADLYIKDMPREKPVTWLVTDVDAGYWRDAYNKSNLLWQMGLSYWAMSEEHPDWFVESDGEGLLLTVDGARGLLALVEEREHMLSDEDDGFGTTFQERAETFKAFLRKAIELKSPIIWSV